MPEMPSEFHKNASVSEYNLVIRKYYNYDGVDVYGIMPKIIETMKQLYEWALNLPEYSIISKMKRNEHD